LDPVRVSTQVRLVYIAVSAAALLFTFDVVLAAFALHNLAGLETKLMAFQQLRQVSGDLNHNMAVAAIGAIALGVLVVFVRLPTNKVRVAIWLIGPLLAQAMLCNLVGGPEWTVAPTGEEPAELRQEYLRAVPGWYVTLHGSAGLTAALLLIFAAVFIFRTDLREYYLVGDDVRGGYRSWVDRTGG
jgi:hypothetical protein